MYIEGRSSISFVVCMQSHKYAGFNRLINHINISMNVDHEERTWSTCKVEDCKGTQISHKITNWQRNRVFDKQLRNKSFSTIWSIPAAPQEENYRPGLEAVQECGFMNFIVCYIIFIVIYLMIISNSLLPCGVQNKNNIYLYYCWCKLV